MSFNLVFHRQTLDCIVGGLSAIDLPRLEIQNLGEAQQFIKSYGYDPSKPQDLEKLWSFHRRAVILMREHLLNDDEKIPSLLTDQALLQNVGSLLVFASSHSPQDRELQRWSCAILRVMHVFAHIENDVFIEFSEQIQEQVLKNFRAHLTTDPVLGSVLGGASSSEKITLFQFDVKPFKATSSAVIKLLSKPHAVALTILDKMGIRFVTRSIFDVFRVIRFLVDEHIINFPNIMPDQSKNTLYPTNLFLEVMKEVQGTGGYSIEKLEKALSRKLEESGHRAEYLEKKNEFSSIEYRSIKFIARHLIELPLGDRQLRFFFPYELQIVDYDTFIKNLTGSTAHDQYKKRQRAVARQRVLSLSAPSTLGGSGEFSE